MFKASSISKCSFARFACCQEFFLSDFFLPGSFNFIFPLLSSNIKWRVTWTVHRTFTCDLMTCVSSRYGLVLRWTCAVDFFFNYFIYPLTARVVGASQTTSQPVSSLFLCSPLPSGSWRTPGLCYWHGDMQYVTTQIKHGRTSPSIQAVQVMHNLLSHILNPPPQIM